MVWCGLAQCNALHKIKWHPQGSLSSLVANHLSVEWCIVCRDACFAVYWKCHPKNIPVQTYDVGEKVFESHLTGEDWGFFLSLSLAPVYRMRIYLTPGPFSVDADHCVKLNVCKMACMVFHFLLFAVYCRCAITTGWVPLQHTKVQGINRTWQKKNIFYFYSDLLGWERTSERACELLLNVRLVVIFLSHWMAIPFVELFI